MKILSAVIPLSIKADNHAHLIQWLSSQDHTSIDVIVVLDQDHALVEQQNEIRNILANFSIKVLSGNFGSPGLARNAGLEASETKWITFWDADDLPLIGNFLQMVEEAHEAGLDVCLGDYIFRDLNSGATKYRKITNSATSSNLPILIGKDPGIWRFGFRRRILQKNFCSLRMAEDQIFLMENGILNREIYLGRKFVYCYFYGGAKQATSNRSLIGELKQAISITSDHLLLSDSKKECKFETMLLARQSLTSIKRGSLGLKLWSIHKLIRIHRQLNKENQHNLLLNLRSLFLNKGTHKKNSYVPLTGGLGNQLFQYAYALNKAQNSEWTLVSNIGAPRVNIFGTPELFSFNISMPVSELSSLTSNWLVKKSSGYMLRVGVIPKNFEKLYLVRIVTQFAWKSILTLSLRENISPLAAHGVGHFEPVYKRRSNFDYGYFQSNKWADSVVDELRQLSLAETSSSVSSYEELARVEKPLVVHVRLGDYKLETNFGFPGVSYYSRAIDYAWATGKFRSIWIFSDEKESAIKFLPTEHKDHYRLIDDEYLSSAEVLELMRLGQGYVIANSTFSWWGAYLSKSINPLVIAPSPWFSKVESPKDLIPDSWMTIETIPGEQSFENFEGM